MTQPATIRRHLSPVILEALRAARVVHLVGPRQAGKSTLVRALVPEHQYLTMDDGDIRRTLQDDAMGQLKSLLKMREDPRLPIVIDEFQRMPSLSLAIKRIVDEYPERGSFLLTGSADVLQTGAATDSLAGRVLTLRLLPLSTSEIKGRGPCALLDAVWTHGEAFRDHLPAAPSIDRSDLLELIARGGYPEMRVLNEPMRTLRFESYLDSVIERDAAALFNVRKPDALRRLIHQIAARTAQELNVARLCGALNVRRETVVSWLELLERLSLTQQLGAWTSAPAHREIKSPKLHLLDSGCAAALRGEDESTWLLPANGRALSALFESWVVTEFAKMLPTSSKPWRLWHWRADEREIDLVLTSSGGRMLLVEIKAASRLRDTDIRHLEWFMDEGPGKDSRCTAIILYLGERTLPLRPRVTAMPVSMLWAWPALPA